MLVDTNDTSSVGDNDDVNTIVKSVVNTIRDLSSKLGMNDMKPCPICGDVITGKISSLVKYSSENLAKARNSCKKCLHMSHALFAGAGEENF